MTSKIIVNNIEADSGVSTVTFNSKVASSEFVGNVTGNVNSTGVTTVSSLRIGTGTSISSPATNVLTLGTNNIERIRVGAGGSVNIGATDTSYKLQVTGAPQNTINFGILHIRDSQTLSGAAGTGGIFLSSSPGTDYYIAKGYNGSNTKLKFGNGNNGNEYMGIDDSGGVTMPYQPMMHVYQCTGASMTVTGNTTSTLIPATNNSYDPNGNLDTSTGIYTVPITGRYLVYYGTQGKTALNTNCGSIYYNVNNSGISGQCLYYGEAYSGNSQNVILSLSAGDNVRWQINGNNNQSYAINGAHYGIILIG